MKSEFIKAMQLGQLVNTLVEKHITLDKAIHPKSIERIAGDIATIMGEISRREQVFRNPQDIKGGQE